MKRLFVISSFLIIFFISMFLSCTTTRNSQPEWVDNYRVLFPESDYIVQRGSGNHADEAKNKAIQAIAEYMNTQVQSRRVLNLKTTQIDDNITEEKQIENQIIVTSDIELLGLEYTESWKEPKTKIWYCVAYIHRETAWNLYEPQIRLKKNDFYAFYNKAQEEKEPFFRIRYYSEAKKSGKIFIDSLSYAQLFSEKLTNIKYRKDLEILSTINMLQEQTRQGCPIYILVQGDVSDIVYSSANEVLSDCGLIITKKQNQAVYEADVKIEYNQKMMNGMIVMSPSVMLLLNGGNGSVFSFSTSTNRVNGLNENIVRTKACEEIAKIIEEKLLWDLNTSFGVEK